MELAPHMVSTRLGGCKEPSKDVELQQHWRRVLLMFITNLSLVCGRFEMLGIWTDDIGQAMYANTTAAETANLSP